MQERAFCARKVQYESQSVRFAKVTNRFTDSHRNTNRKEAEVNQKRDRYDVSGLPEAQFEPGSRGLVLKNLLGVTQKKKMDALEGTAQAQAMERLFGRFDADHRFSSANIREIHKTWLGHIYPWAGDYRQLNVSKGDFPFAAAAQIPRLMEEFENGPLRKFTPCRFESVSQVAKALALVHAELVLIHPFRDGNGRAARMLAVLMAAQAGLPPLNFGRIHGRLLESYFAAVRAGLARDYQPMVELFELVLAGTTRRVGKK